MGRMTTNSREAEIQKSRQLVSDEQLLAILRAMRKPGQPEFAVEQINEDLDAGETLDQIFYTGKTDGFHLKIKRRSASSLEIEFSWTFEQHPAGSPPFSEGAGGTWIVELDVAGGVHFLDGGMIWMSRTTASFFSSKNGGNAKRDTRPQCQ
jgi:hypothetical protein